MMSATALGLSGSADRLTLQVWRTTADAGQMAMLRPTLQQLPPQFSAARAFHLGVHPNRPSITLLHTLRDALSQHSDGR